LVIPPSSKLLGDVLKELLSIPPQAGHDAVQRFLIAVLFSLCWGGRRRWGWEG
jgi:hypothetical protein